MILYIINIQGDGDQLYDLINHPIIKKKIYIPRFVTTIGIFCIDTETKKMYTGGFREIMKKIVLNYPEMSECREYFNYIDVERYLNSIKEYIDSVSPKSFFILPKDLDLLVQSINNKKKFEFIDFNISTEL